MTGSEMIEYLRNDVVDDAELPYKWLDAELLRFLNYAEVQACRRAHLIVDWTTTNDYGTSSTAGTGSTDGQRPVTKVVLVGDQASYNLSRKILQIKRCQVSSMTYPLEGPVSYPQLDDQLSGWWGTNGTVGTAGSGGYPTFFVNEPNDTITFVRAPSEAGTARLVVSRLPLLSFGTGGVPEVDDRYHEGLMNWAAHLAFSKPNEKTYNANLAAIYEKKFIQQFGSLPDAYNERMRKVLAQRGKMRAREFGT